jgi:hypothetical protein
MCEVSANQFNRGWKPLPHLTSYLGATLWERLSSRDGIKPENKPASVI